MEHVVYEETTTEQMQSCVDAWIMDFKNAMRSLHNIRLGWGSPHLTQKQRDSLKSAVFELEHEVKRCRSLHLTRDISG